VWFLKEVSWVLYILLWLDVLPWLLLMLWLSLFCKGIPAEERTDGGNMESLGTEETPE